MANITGQYNTYVGMRYVPIFGGQWDATADYEPLTIVTYQGNSYTSRTFVPAGTAVDNTTYWALTGNYNAQVEQYRQEVVSLRDSIGPSTRVYETLDDLQDADVNLGSLATILGRTEAGDQGAATYYIREKDPAETANGMDRIALGSTAIAELVPAGYVTPMQFGAACNGVTNDSPAIAAALLYAADKNIPVIIDKDSQCVMDTPIFLPSYAHLIIEGEVLGGGNEGNTYFTTADGVTSYPVYTGPHDIVIEGSGVVNMRGQTFSSYGPTPFRIFHSKNVTIKDITIRDISMYHAIEIGGSSDVLVDNVRFEGLHVNGNSHGWHQFIQLEPISEAGTGIAIPFDGTRPQNVTIRNCWFGASANSGICFCAIADESVYNSYVSNVDIYNNTIDSCTHVPIFILQYYDNLHIRNNIFRNVTTNVTGQGDRRGVIMLGGSYLKNITIKDNIFDDTTGELIELGMVGDYDANKNIKDITICGNVFGDFVKDLNADASGVGGIDIRNTVDGLSIIGNTFNSAHNKPIMITTANLAACERVWIADNALNLSTPIEKVTFNAYNSITDYNRIVIRDTTESDPVTILENAWDVVPQGTKISGTIQTSGFSYTFDGIAAGQYGAFIVQGYDGLTATKVRRSAGTFTTGTITFA